MIYIVTIMNDCSLLDGQGYIHTWLMIQATGLPTKYFSFSYKSMTGIVGTDFTGISSEEEMVGRIPTEWLCIEIDKAQYEKLFEEIEKFYEKNPKYDVTPDHNGDYNCVTASSCILMSAGIEFLKDCQTPHAVGNKIKGKKPGILENWMDAKDCLDNWLDTNLGGCCPFMSLD